MTIPKRKIISAGSEFHMILILRSFRFGSQKNWDRQIKTQNQYPKSKLSFFLNLFFAVHWISHHVQNIKKKSREFPLGGPSPCGKTRLAPCRQCTFSIFFVCSASFFFRPNLQLQTPKSKIKNQTFKMASPKK